MLSTPLIIMISHLSLNGSTITTKLISV